jgi:hypothetical protein
VGGTGGDPAADPSTRRSQGARHHSPSPSTTGGGGAGTTGSSPTPAPTPTTTTPESAGTPGASAGGPEQAVVDYYGLLPDDTADAWAMLGPAAQQEAGGYGRYQGFWRSISSVAVGGTSLEGDVVVVDLTYDGDDSETRRLEVTRSGGRWVIAQDLGAG